MLGWLVAVNCQPRISLGQRSMPILQSAAVGNNTTLKARAARSVQELSRCKASGDAMQQQGHSKSVSSAAAWLLAPAGAAVLLPLVLAICYSHAATRSGKGENGENDDSKPTTGSETRGDGGASPPFLLAAKNTTVDKNEEAPRFAWEPVVVTHTIDTKTTPVASEQQQSLLQKPAERSITTRHVDQKQEEQESSLEFLSSMSFANGGLRSPSCPCCQ